MLRYFTVLLLLVPGLLAGQSELFGQAEKSYVLGQFQDALKMINQKIERRAEAQDHLLRALIYKSMDLNANAYDDFAEAIRRDKEYLEAYFLFAEFLSKTHEYTRALASLNELLNRLESGDTQGIFFRIDRMGEQNLRVESMRTMEAQILVSRARAYQGLGRDEEALTDYNAAIFIHATEDKYVNRSALLKKMGRMTEAKEDLRSALEINPRYGLAWFNLFVLDPDVELPEYLGGNQEFGPMLSARAVEAMEKKQFQLAQKLFDQALRLAPDDPLLLLNAGRLDFKNGFFRGALEKFLKVQEIDPGRTEVLYLIGNVHFGRKDHKRALDYYRDYLTSDPADGNIWYNSAMCYLALKDYENACKCLSRALDLGMTSASGFMDKYCASK